MQLKKFAFKNWKIGPWTSHFPFHSQQLRKRTQTEQKQPPITRDDLIKIFWYTRILLRNSVRSSCATFTLLQLPFCKCTLSYRFGIFRRFSLELAKRKRTTQRLIVASFGLCMPRLRRWEAEVITGDAARWVE